jgi:xanthine permease XanP
MARRPANLIYGVDDRPPAMVLLALGVQHLFLMSSTLVLSVVLVTELGHPFQEVRAVVALTMIACGIGTLLQAMRWRGVGSGFLCPNLCGPNFFSSCVSAAWLGGLPLMRGMTIFAGLVEVVFARFLHRLAFLFPPEITGLVVFMVGLSLVPVGVSDFLHIEYAGESIQALSMGVSALTLFTMVGVSLWGSKKLKLFSVLVGLAVGYALAALAGLLPQDQVERILLSPWLGLPQYEGMWGIDFRWSLAPTFAIVSICGALKSFGNLAMCEKVNDEEWKAPDIRRIADGLVADGLAVTASGLLGAVASDTSASNVGLSAATGATSRYIGYAAGGLSLLLGFSPKVGAVLSVMPAPVAGAILIYVTCYMLLSGLQIILSLKMDPRRTFVIGISLVFGFSLEILPQLYVHIPGWLRPLFESSLTLSAVLAIVLNQVFRAPRGGDQQGEAAPPAEVLAE